MKALANFACLIVAASAQWGAQKPPPDCACGNHFQKYGTMDGFNTDPITSKYKKTDYVTPEESLLELEDDRVCTKCARGLVTVERHTVALDSFDLYLRAMDRRRDARAKYIENMAAKVEESFFNVDRRPPPHINSPSFPAALLKKSKKINAPTQPSRTNVKKLSANPLLSSLLKKKGAAP